MRQNTYFLKEYAHKVYFQGLLDTGISFERIPRIQEMNDILWPHGLGAVAVNGPALSRPRLSWLRPPQGTLVIACDMRQIHNIEYTPGRPTLSTKPPGTSPIVVDQECSALLPALLEN